MAVLKDFNGGVAMKKSFLSALLALLIVCCSYTMVYGAEDTVLEEKKLTAEVGCSAADLQKLLDENSSGKYELTIQIPAGTYKLTQTLYVYPNTIIEAEDDTILEKQSLYGAMLEAQLPKGSTGYGGNHDITIEGGIWDSTPVMKDKSGTETFRFANCSDITVVDVVLRNVPENSQLLVLAGVKNVTITNCTFYGYENWQQAKMAEAIQITSTDVVCDDVTILGCEFYQLPRAIGSECAEGKYHTNVKIDSNEFHELSDTAVYFANQKKGRISGNTMKDIADTSIYVTASPEIRILNNTIEKTGNHGIYLYQSGGTDANNCSKIGNNTITGKKSGKHGIYIKNSKYTAIYSNSVADIGGTGIYMYNSKNCKVGLGSNTNNTIENTKEAGIYVKNCDGIKVQYNKITGTKREGIAIYSSEKLSINRNTIEAGTNGILVKNNCPFAVIGNNTIKKAGKNGIIVSGKCKRVKINSNTIKKYATSLKNGAGISISQAGGTSSKKYSTVSKNKITGTGKSTSKYGIRVANSRYTKVESNTLNYIPGTAISVTKTKNCTVNKNTIKQPKKLGIAFASDCDRGKISANTINKAASTSIEIKDAPKTLIYANTIKANRNKKGIVVRNSKETTIKTNTIKVTKEALAIKIFKSKDCEESNNTID